MPDAGQGRQMHWLLISAGHHPDHGGIGAYVTRLCHDAVRAGWRIELVTRPGATHPPGVVVHEVDTPDMQPAFDRRVARLRRIERIRPCRYGMWSLAAARKLLEIDARPDAIELVECRAEGYVALRSRRVRSHFAGIPMIVHAHTPMFVEEAINGADMQRFGRPIYHEWERQTLSAADGVIVTSRRLRDRLGLAEAEVIPYPLGEVPQPSRPAGNEKETIVLIGTVQPRKGVDIWARSLNVVLRRRPQTTAMLIGADTMTGPGGTSMAARIGQIIDPDLRPRFRWHPAMPHDAAMDILNRAALAVVPSLLESFSYVAAEVILRGCPVIITEQVGLSEHVDGMPMSAAGDSASLAELQLRVLAAPVEAQRDARALRDRLLDASAADKHLRLRAEYARRLAATTATRVDAPTPDAIAEMEQFLASVEEAERSAGGQAGAPAAMAGQATGPGGRKETGR